MKMKLKKMDKLEVVEDSQCTQTLYSNNNTPSSSSSEVSRASSKPTKKLVFSRDTFESDVRQFVIREAELEYDITRHQGQYLEAKNENRELSVRYATLEHNHWLLEEKLEEETGKLDAAMRRSMRLKKDLDDLRASSQVQAESSASLEKDVAEKSKKASALEKRVEKLEKELETAKSQAKASKEEVKAAKEEAKSLKAEIKTLQKQNTEESATRIAELERELESASSQIQLAEEAARCAQEQVASMQMEASTAVKERDGNASRIEKLEKSLETAKAQQKTAKEELKEAIAEVAALKKKGAEEAQEKITQLEAELKEAQKEIKSLKKKGSEEAQEKLTTLEKELKDAKKELKSLGKEKDSLAAELEASQKEAEDSTKILKEKLALSRDLKSLQAENESLRTECESYQQVLSEKMSLEREVQTLKAELENEKKSCKKSNKSKAETTELKKTFEKELSELKDQLAKQTKLLERSQRDREKDKEDWESKNSILQKKLDNTKTKLKAAKTEEAAKPKIKKRPATAFDVEDDTPPKRARKSTVMKSTFSTTPFLKRQTSVMPLSPNEEESSVADDSMVTTTTSTEATHMSKSSDEPSTVTEAISETLVEPTKNLQSVATADKDLMPPPPPPVSKAAAKKAAEKPVKLLLGKSALSHTKNRASSVQPASSRPSLLGDEDFVKPKGAKGGKKAGKLNKENLEPDTILEVDEPSPQVIKKPKMRKLQAHTLGKTLFDDDGTDDNWGKIRAPSVSGFNNDFSPLKVRANGLDIRNQFRVRASVPPK